MIQAGRLQPISIGDELDTVALHLESPTASQPLQPDMRESLETTMVSMKRVIRQRVSDEDMDTFITGMGSVADEIATPTSSQPRDPEVLERAQQAYKELGADLIRKKLFKPRTRKPNKKKVSAFVPFLARTTDHQL